MSKHRRYRLCGSTVNQLLMMCRLSQLLKHSSVFCSTFSLNQTAAAWPRSVWISHKRNVANSWFCAVLQSARCTGVHEHPIQYAFHLFQATAHLGTTFRKKKNIFFCSGSVCVFFAGGSFFLFFQSPVSYANGRFAVCVTYVIKCVTHPWLRAPMRTCVSVMCTPDNNSIFQGFGLGFLYSHFVTPTELRL